MTYIEKARQLKLNNSNSYKAVFDHYVTAINGFWSADIQAYMKNEFPSFAEAINESERNLDRFWGVKPLADFKKEMYRFYKLHEKIFELYKYGDEEK